MPLLSLALTGCGNASNDPPEREIADFESIRLSPSTEDEPSEPLTMDRLTAEYLAGTWCFSRPGGGGERGSYVFESDGTYRAAVTGFPQEMSGDIESFRGRYDGLVEMGPDRFVVRRGAYPVAFERGSC